MVSFQSLSIRKKLRIITISSVLIAVLLTGLASLFFTQKSYQKMARDNIFALAHVIAENSTVPLMFSLPDDATDVLSSLNSKKTIVVANLYDSKGILFATYQRDKKIIQTPKQANILGIIFTTQNLDITLPVYFKGEQIGSLSIHESMHEMDQSMQRISLTMLLIMGVALIIAYLIAVWFQFLIIKPTTELARIASLISTQKDYSIRAKKYAGDELGQLTDTFNDMLSQIQIRDSSLRESETRERIITEHAPEAIVIIDTDNNRFIYVNENAVQLYGVPRNLLLNMTPYDLSPRYQSDGKLSRQASLEYMNRTLHGGLPIFEWIYFNHQGKEIPCEVRLVHLPQTGRRLVRASITDITHRKEAERELYRLRNYLKNIVDSMPSILVGVDVEGKVTQWNKEAEKITGINAENAEGYQLVDVYPQIQADMDRVFQAITRRLPFVDHKVASQKNGKIQYNEITVFPLIANGIQGAVIRVDDITDRIRIEEMMVQSEKMLSVGGLAAGMAHELNNPLAGIIQNLQVIRNRLSSKLPKNIRTAEQYGISMEDMEAYMKERGIFEMIKAVMESGQRATKIINNMLSFSRKSSGNKELTNLSELLEDVVDLAVTDYSLTKKHDFRQIKIIRDYAEDLPPVRCDPNQIQQVLLNILKNGAQAMSGYNNDKVSSQFILRTFFETQWVCLEIEDNGQGMDEETCKRAFEPFFTTKEVGVGTGLGLSVSYFIITENHNGQMAVKSAPDQGARFIIKLQRDVT